LASTIARLLQDEALRERLGRQAAAHAQKYAWPHVADRLLETFETERSVPLQVLTSAECA